MARRKKGHHEEGEEMSEAWLLPYSDLMTLLLAVFIVLFAVSKVDVAKAEEITNAFRGIFEMVSPKNPDDIIDKDGVIFIVPSPLATTTVEPTPKGGGDSGNSKDSERGMLEKMQTELQNYFAGANADLDITMHIDERGLVISLDNSILFDSGKADINPEYVEILTTIGETINKLDNYIRVEGHTDNRPIKSTLFPSNWELSSARAASVVRLFVTKSGVNPGKMVTIGYGEFKPIENNDTQDGRSKNRRVDIILLSTKYNSLEDPLTDIPTH